MIFTKTHLEDKILSNFSRREIFTREELWEFVRQLDPTIKEARLNYILLDLKKKGRLIDIGKGVYRVGPKIEFNPEPNEIIKRIARYVNEVGELEGPYNIWSTGWLNEFLELQATTTMYIVGVDKASVERIFFMLSEQNNVPDPFLNPDKSVIEHYISGTSEVTVVCPFISRAPVEVRHQLSFPTLEKILVDLFCDTDLFLAYQGFQLVQIFQAAFSKYSINFSRLFNYARRRNRELALEQFLSKNTDTQNEINSTKK